MGLFKKIKKAAVLSAGALMLSSLVIPYASADRGNENKAQVKTAPQLSVTSKDILTINGKEYKDLNDNGKLDKYENWDLPVNVRVKDLVKQMTLEEKAGMMLISSHYMGNSRSCPDTGGFITCEQDTVSTTNRWSVPGQQFHTFDPPIVEASAATKGIQERNLRYLIIRDNPSAKDLATWINELQKIAEDTRLGIPVVMTSNPRNHAGNLAFGFSEASGQFSVWPGELGLAATRDADLVKEFGEIAAKEWTSTGIRKGYMYMADVVTDPLWNRINGTFGEHPDLASEMIYAVVKGFQGDELGKHSVSLTTKHFPGGGARQDGHDPHYEWSKFNPYPTEGSLYKYHLPSFKAAIAAGTTSIMPYYAYPSNEYSVPQLKNGEEFEEVGFAYNKRLITDLLRKELKFEGYVNSDTSIIYAMPWGVENLTKPERYAKAINAGTDIISGEADPADLIKAVKEGLISEKRIDEAVSRLVTEMMELGLFENPYVDPNNAQQIADDPASQVKADEAHRKSIVLLRNDQTTLPLTDEKVENIKLYVEVFSSGSSAQSRTADLKKSITQYDSSITVVDKLEEATHALVYAIPNTVPDRPDVPLSVALNAETGINVDRIKEIEEAVPTILTVNMTSPWLIGEIEENAAATLAVFGVKAEALVDVIRGKFAPTGKLPFTIPADQEAINNNNGDVPGYDEDSSYVYRDKNGNAYGFDFGLTYDK
ncbi:glycoside hydrolase family 3 N-terminal domain-containing protein [Neobacillus niacini]|uniref:glycoside hydrolase family 3 protein n=1 Tax=Neobacillus niacini TaxID=86668 RepID=UPI0007ABC1DC|nr:glycoside hydrolase family 3 N-terminal domain-containing protein [Neobacillus niacini]MEC1525454.1 glycoside hydrolase family 3 N-terminal domain-containing protein [Neobacillus niacini]